MDRPLTLWDIKLEKRAKVLYFLGGVLVVGSLVFNTYASILVFELKGRIEEFYQKDFVDVREVSDQLVRDIEAVYGEKFPTVELNIRLSEYSKIGIRYDGKLLYLFLPPQIIGFSNGQKRAYLAHEFGHYVLGHIDSKNTSSFSYFGAGDIIRDIQADSFSLSFSNKEDLSLAIRTLVWEEKERGTRLAAIGA